MYKPQHTTRTASTLTEELHTGKRGQQGQERQVNAEVRKLSIVFFTASYHFAFKVCFMVGDPSTDTSVDRTVATHPSRLHVMLGDPITDTSRDRKAPTQQPSRKADAGTSSLGTYCSRKN